MQQQQNITVQLIDAAGRSLGRLSLPSNLSLPDLERLCVAAGSPSLSAHLEQHVAAKARQLAQEAGL
ncbi:hypothetical protein [Azotobacter salinestris]|uniref:hypothetical protein n=1 Tax=Azotobacter salinestris TaxID=69964 RepID=UPI0032DE7901